MFSLVCSLLVSFLQIALGSRQPTSARKRTNGMHVVLGGGSVPYLGSLFDVEDEKRTGVPADSTRKKSQTYSMSVIFSDIAVRVATANDSEARAYDSLAVFTFRVH